MTGKVRIISGNWRGRKLEVPDLPGLRPSGDRVREVLFNWLQGKISGKRCLDLFAGTGALGLEAASRGAGQLTLVENNPVLSRALKGVQQLWPGADQVKLVHQDVLAFLRQGPPACGFDLVFLDPPFDAGLYAPCLDLLLSGEWLADQARVYVEYSAKDDQVPALFERHWQVLRQKTVGEVAMSLMTAS